MVMFVMVMATVSLLVGMLAVYIDGQGSDVTMPGWLRVIAVRGLARLYRLPGATEAPVRSVHASVVDPTESEAKPPHDAASDFNDILNELRFITNLLKNKEKDCEKQNEWKLLATAVDRTLFWVCIGGCVVYFLIFSFRADTK